MTYAEQVAEYERLNAAVNEIEREQQEAINLRTAFLHSVAGVAVGDVITDGRREMRVVKVSASGMHPIMHDRRFSKPYVSAVGRLKNGQWGTREYQPWDWKLARTADEEATRASSPR